MISSESVQKSDVFQWYFSFCAAHFDLTVFIAVSVAILIKVTGLHWTLETLTLGPLFLYKSLSQQTSKLHLFTGCMSAASSPGSIHQGIITYLKNFCTEKVCGGNWSEKARCIISVWGPLLTMFCSSPRQTYKSFHLSCFLSQIFKVMDKNIFTYLHIAALLHLLQTLAKLRDRW